MTVDLGLDYVWIRLPLILLYLSGYLMYRMVVVSGLTDGLVRRAILYTRGQIRYLILMVMVTAAVLSFFIPNAVTVLILLPVLKTLDADYQRAEGNNRLTTPLALAAIYGANIGGMGSIIGSPANLLLIGALDLYQVPGREQINFFSWFLWSVPLVAGLIAIGWMIIVGVAMGRRKPSEVAINPLNPDKWTSTQKISAVLFGTFIVFWVAESVAELSKGFPLPVQWLSLGFMGGMILAIFCGRYGSQSVPLLTLDQLVSQLPRRGVALVVVVMLIIGGVRWLELDQHLSQMAKACIPAHISLTHLTMAVSAAVLFLTELLSNTVVSTAFFPVVHAVAGTGGYSVLTLMIAVSAASTCAFMTPVATPCNALVFGEMKGTSLMRMILAGSIMNVISAVVMSSWLAFMIPALVA